jgi:hypothetical protein
MGLTPDGWGPYFWATVHLSALGAPSVIDSIQGSGYRSFYSALPWVIPCQSCSEHLKENLQKMPLSDEVLKGNEPLFAWTVQLHNEVNQMLGKPTVTIEQAKTFWMKVAENNYPPFRKDTPVNSNGGLKTIVGIAILFGIGFIGFQMLKKRQKRRS